jgi:PAS domain S-box-containing protein
MKDEDKTKEQLIDELRELRRQVAAVGAVKYTPDSGDQLLEMNEAVFRHFVENANDIVYSLATEGTFTYVSPTWTELLGHDVNEVVGHSFESFVYPEDIPVCHAFMMKTIVTGEKQAGVEYRVRNKNGEWRWHTTNAAPVRDADGNIITYMGIARDITQRKQMEESLCESENKFRVLTEKAVVGVYLAQKGVLQYINPKFAEIVGYEMDELIMRKPKDFITPEDQPRAREYSRKLTSGEAESLHYELRMVKKSGDVVSVESYGSRIMYNGQPAVIGTIIDITDRKRAEKERRHREKLESALEITGAVCHEMNQPMQIISGYSELLLQTVSENDQIYMKIDRINRQIKRMAAITRKLRAINNYKTRDYAGNIRIMDINESSDDDIKTKI